MFSGISLREGPLPELSAVLQRIIKTLGGAAVDAPPSRLRLDEMSTSGIFSSYMSIFLPFNRILMGNIR